MARKSVKEILEAARKGGPVPAAGDSPSDTAVPEAPEAPASAGPAPPPASPRPAAPAAPAGRPLSLKEKLAAARSGAAPAAPAPAAEPAASDEAPVETSAAPAGPAANVPTPAELGRPLTVAEKLAAARAKGGAAPAAKPAARPAAASTAAPTTAKAAPKRELPPLAEISDPKDLAEALRQAGAKHEADAAAAARAAQPAPATKAKAKEFKADSVLPRPSREAAGADGGTPSAGRRRFLTLSALSAVSVAWGSFTAGTLAFTAMLGRFMFPNVLAEPPSTIKIGAPTNYDPESVNERFKAEWGFWIVRSTRYNGEDIIYALQSVCTHLGCPPNWLEGEQKFKCPCHGSGFYISGVNFEGPAPRPLERFKITVADDGQMVVDKSQKYQHELDQWSDPESFVAAV